MTVSSSLVTSSPCRVSSMEEPRLPINPQEYKLVSLGLIEAGHVSRHSRSAGIYVLVSDVLRLWETPGICGIVNATTERVVERERKRQAEEGRVLAIGSEVPALKVNRASGDAR